MGRLELPRPEGHCVLSAMCLPFHHNGIKNIQYQIVNQQFTAQSKQKKRRESYDPRLTKPMNTLRFTHIEDGQGWRAMNTNLIDVNSIIAL